MPYTVIGNIRGPVGAQGTKGDTGGVGPTGSPGVQGPAGPGIAPGGTVGQVLVKASAADYATSWKSPTALFTPIGISGSRHQIGSDVIDQLLSALAAQGVIVNDTTA